MAWQGKTSTVVAALTYVGAERDGVSGFKIRSPGPEPHWGRPREYSVSSFPSKPTDSEVMIPDSMECRIGGGWVKIVSILNARNIT